MSDSLFKSFTQNKCPSWRCPDCFNETLAIVPGSFFKAYNGETTRCKNEEWFWADHVRLVFSCVLLCERSQCGATVAVTGEGRTEEENYYDENNQVQSNYPDYFQAKTFYPALPLFLPPQGCPESVLEQLASVSSLLTGHSTAAANAIRSLLEVLLDDLGVPRMVLTKEAKQHFLPLHTRIKDYSQLLGPHHDAFMALKHFGNAGSHGGESIAQSHLEDACEVLELIITLLYQKHPDVSDHISRLDKAFSRKR